MYIIRDFSLEYKITLVHFFFNEVPRALPLALIILTEGANVIEFVHCDKLAKKFSFITILGRLSLEKLVHRVIEVNKLALLDEINIASVITWLGAEYL